MGISVYNKIKKQNGEKFAKTIRNYHNGIFEIPELDRIVRYAGSAAEPIMSYLMSLLAVNDDVPAAGDPFDLLKQAGYNAFTADTLEKQNSIKNYFAKGELLCTFNDASRHEDFHIVHAVKEDADKIQREDFRGKESRQDEYGTSVISIQMMKKGGFISIKNRYNHKVANSDNTFKSNPDNIIFGLSSALKEHFNVDFSASKTALPEGYQIFDKQIFKYHTEQNNIYYGDGSWVDGGEIKTVNKTAGDAMFDWFVFDNKTKTLKKIDSDYEDSFADDFNRYYGGNKGLYVKDGNLMLGDDVLIGTEKSRIKTIYLPELTTAGNQFLSRARALTEFNAPNLATTGDRFLSDAHALTEFNAPNLTTTGGLSLSNANALTHFEANALTTTGDHFLFDAHALTEFNAPNLATTGHSFLKDARALTEFNTPNLTTTDIEFLTNATALTKFNAPALKNIPDYILKYVSKNSSQNSSNKHSILNETTNYLNLNL